MRFVVVGAGIAGLVAAVAAHRAGHEVTVIERSVTGSAAGAGISLFGNALRGLDSIRSGTSLTVGERVRSKGEGLVPGSTMGFRTPRGRWLVRSTVGSDGRWAEGSEVVVVHRADLQCILLNELPSEVVHFGTTCLNVAQLPDGAEVTWKAPTEQGTSVGDIVIAADGINSPLRKAHWPDDPGIRYSGYTSWRGITAGPFQLPSGGETWGRGERFGCALLQDGRVYWFATASVKAGSSYPDERAEVLRRFGHWHDPIPELIAATPAENVLHHDINDLARPLKTFVRGRVVLAGDSAHAMTPDLGQGGCQAIEDSVTLITLLGGAQSQDVIRRALEAYDDVRRRRTQPIAARARRVGQVAQLSSRVAAGIRDAVLTAMPSSVVLGAGTAIQQWTPPASA
jgi:2-polyprenyl-6-methoxyphenol hydroxylase-like FAD-dependent oxidoreductase